jgi:hypothetical protein
MKRAGLRAMMVMLLGGVPGNAAVTNGPPEIAFNRIVHGWTNYSTAFNATHDTGRFGDLATLGITYTPGPDQTLAEYAVIVIWDGTSNQRFDFSNFTFRVGIWSGLEAFIADPERGDVASVDFAAPTGGSTTVPDTTTRGGRPAYELRFDLAGISTVLTNAHSYVIGFAARSDTDSFGELFVPTAGTSGPSDIHAGSLVPGGWGYLADAGGSTIYSGQIAAELMVRPLIELPRLVIRRSGLYVDVLWPAEAVGFELEFSSDLALLASWHHVEIDPEEAGGWKKVTLPATGARRFFRLVRSPGFRL